MSISDQERWDERWAEPKRACARAASLLVSFVLRNPQVRGRALDVACGVDKIQSGWRSVVLRWTL